MGQRLAENDALVRSGKWRPKYYPQYAAHLPRWFVEKATLEQFCELVFPRTLVELLEHFDSSED